MSQTIEQRSSVTEEQAMQAIFRNGTDWILSIGAIWDSEAPSTSFIHPIQFELEGQYTRITIIPINGSQRKFSLTPDQQSKFTALLESPISAFSFSRQMNGNARMNEFDDVPAFESIQSKRAHSINMYQVKTDIGEAIVMAEGLENGSSVRVHTQLNNLQICSILENASFLKETLLKKVNPKITVYNLRSGHIVGNVVSMDYFCQENARKKSTEYNLMDELNKRMVLTLLQNGYICIGSDGSIIERGLIEELIKNKTEVTQQENDEYLENIASAVFA
jgi:hypothetical protein